MNTTARKIGRGILAVLLCCTMLVSCSFPGLDALLDTSSGASGVSDIDNSAGSDASAAEDGQTPPAAAGDNPFVPEYAVQAEAACFVNEDTGLVVYEKNPDQPLAAASLVKMMTCILTVESVADLDAERVTSDKTWIYDELYGQNASTADIRKGETLSVRELLYAALLPSANEAALLLADHVSGGYMVNFLYMMNTRAKTLGCTGTVFTSPNGLAEEDVTTARDMVLITRAFMSYPELVEIAATASYEMAAHEAHAAPYYISTTNRLLVASSPYYSAFPNTAGCVVAGKTGSIGEWQNFASMARKNGESYIGVVLHSPNAADPLGPNLDPAQARPALYEAAALYDWAFSNLAVRPALDVSQPVTEIHVRYSAEQDTVRLLPASDLKTVLPLNADDTQLKRIYDLPEYLSAPVQKGDIAGSITLLLGGQVVGTTDLVVEKDIQRNNTLYMVGRVGDFFSSTFLKIVVLVLLAAAAVYAALVYRAHKKRQSKKTGRPAGAAAHPPGARPHKAPRGDVKRPTGTGQSDARHETGTSQNATRKPPPKRGAPPPGQRGV